MSSNVAGASSNDLVDRATSLTLGGVIDGYYRLSDSEKRVFQLAAGLVPIGAQQGNPVQPVTTGQPAAAGPALPVVGNPTNITPNVLAPGQPVPEGHTRDPKTGKVYKLVQKKDKTPERISLENNLSAAKQAFSKFIRDNNVKIKDVTTKGGKIEKQLDCVLDQDLGLRFGLLRGTMDSRKRELDEFKSSHPEQFAPPPTRKGKNAKTGSA